ncbi:hypothetical protein [Streptomyces sp. MK5]|uniref:hypothetical protein n=1 Tax=Streptomyces sp. MK5 TaxID=3064253 RepID=UPI0027421470|nr:hypothetical protein [Streptomyces sp. MK5]
MFAIIGAWFAVVGLVFTFNPMGLGEKLVRQNFRAGGVRLMVTSRYLARRLGIMFLAMGCGLLASWGLLAAGVEESTLVPLLPVAVLALFVLVGSTIFAIYRASSRREDS